MNKGNLLIVDDEPILLKNLKINLEDYADNIFTASNGLDALEVFKREKSIVLFAISICRK